MEIGIQIRHAAWRSALPEVRQVTRKAVNTVLAMKLHPEDGELSIVLANDTMLRTLNSDYRGINKPTNVLAFPYGGTGKRTAIGDVVISLERTSAEAKQAERNLSDHLSHLIVHGVLHLLGYNHDDDGSAESMEALEIRALAKIGIANPYSAPDAAKCNER